MSNEFKETTNEGPYTMAGIRRLLQFVGLFSLQDRTGCLCALTGRVLDNNPQNAERKMLDRLQATFATLHSRVVKFVVIGGIAASSFIVSAWAYDEVKPADLVLLGGKLVTVDQKTPQAEALAARGERIVAVGTVAELKKLIGPNTRVIDLKGKLAVPGFIEGHGHFMSLGRAKMILDLTRVSNWDEIVQLVAKAVQKAKPGEWIDGRGWHQEHWGRPPRPNVDGYPTHRTLSRISRNNPVLLTHGTGHMCFANALAMHLAGVDRNTPDPKGGQILRDEQGNPTGVFREAAQSLIYRERSKARASRTAAQLEKDALRAFQLATQECLAKGVTSFQDAGSSFALIDRFKRLADAGKLKLRLWVMVRDNNERMRDLLPKYRTVNDANGYLSVRAIKRMVDGALGSHGAWLLKPYNDMPSSSGLNVESLTSIKQTALLAIKHDYQLNVHAIGDRANREILDLYQTIFRSYPDKQDLRWRIEHAQHIHPDDIPRFGELGVIASMQGNHCTSDGPFVIARLGRKRAKFGAYAWKSLIKSGAMVINGTDAPVEDVNPILSFYASVSRRLQDGTVFFGEQRMSRMEALRSYTINAAYAAFEDSSKGSLVPGKLADIVVLSQDILTIPESAIAKTRVLYTFVGGRMMYAAD